MNGSSPVRGGRDENSRITYRAAAGEDVLIKGSEQITSWVNQGGGVWMVQLPQRFFGDYNPYALNLSGGWLQYGQWLHRGDVYLDGEAFYERKTPEEVKRQAHTWCCRTTQDSTTIWANFGEANPNAAARRDQRPRKRLHARTKRAELHHCHRLPHPALRRELAAARPHGADGSDRPAHGQVVDHRELHRHQCAVRGHRSRPGRRAWITPTSSAFGAHVVRNNVVRRCGQAGIAGQKGATRCLIEGNLIEDTNYRKEFGGWETAAIKFHESVDTVIRGNLIRGVYHQGYGAFGIWMDWGNQGTRITGNIIYNTQAANIYLEMDHGPILVDNNVLIGQGCQELVGRRRVRPQSAGGLQLRYGFRHESPVAVLPAAYPNRGRPQARHSGRRQMVQQHLRSSGTGRSQEGPGLRVGLQCLPGRGQEEFLRR